MTIRFVFHYLLVGNWQVSDLCASYTSWCILSFILFNEASYQVVIASKRSLVALSQSLKLWSLRTQSEMGTKSSNKWIPDETMNVYCILLMEEILHQLTGSLSHYLKGFLHPRWLFGISSISRMSVLCITGDRRLKRFPVLKFEIPPLKERKYSWSGDRLHWWGWMQGKVERL